MDARVKQLWVAWLRDPNNKQAKDKLEVVDENDAVVGRCCLGGLMRLAMADGVQVNTHTALSDSHHDMYCTNFIGTPTDLLAVDATTTTLTGNVMDWAGIRDANPYITVPSKHGTGEARRSLAELNDAGFTFSQIADIIDYFL